MEVVSTLNFVSSKKKKITAAYNFQIKAINSNVMPHDLIRDVGNRKLCIYAIMKLFVVS